MDFGGCGCQVHTNLCQIQNRIAQYIYNYNFNKNQTLNLTKI